MTPEQTAECNAALTYELRLLADEIERDYSYYVADVLRRAADKIGDRAGDKRPACAEAGDTALPAKRLTFHRGWEWTGDLKAPAEPLPHQRD